MEVGGLVTVNEQENPLITILEEKSGEDEHTLREKKKKKGKMISPRSRSLSAVGVRMVGINFLKDSD